MAALELPYLEMVRVQYVRLDNGGRRRHSPLAIEQKELAQAIPELYQQKDYDSGDCRENQTPDPSREDAYCDKGYLPRRNCETIAGHPSREYHR